MRSKNERGVRDIGHRGFPREVVPVAECESIEMSISDLAKAHALFPAREGTLLYVPEPYDPTLTVL